MYGSGLMHEDDNTVYVINIFELEEKYNAKMAPFLKKVDPNAALTSRAKKYSRFPLVNPSNLSNVPPNPPSIVSNPTII